MKLRERELACCEKELSIRELEATVALSTKSGEGARFDSVFWAARTSAHDSFSSCERRQEA
eukprot:1635004-Rhodomonas_salina.1